MNTQYSDMISTFFAWDLDEVLQRIFLHLDPYSLKSSQQVSKQWNNFIKNRIWRSFSGRESILRRLKSQYFCKQPAEETILLPQIGEESQVSHRVRRGV